MNTEARLCSYNNGPSLTFSMLNMKACLCGDVMWMPKWPCSSNICFRRKLERVYSRRADVTAGAGPQSS